MVAEVDHQMADRPEGANILREVDTDKGSLEKRHRTSLSKNNEPRIMAVPVDYGHLGGLR